MGAFDFTPSLILYGAPGDLTIYLSWEVNTMLSLGTTRAHALAGLTNYE